MAGFTPMTCGNSLRNDIMANIVISEEAARDLRVQSRPLLVFLPNHFKPLKIAVSDRIKFMPNILKQLKLLITSVVEMLSIMMILHLKIIANEKMPLPSNLSK